MLPPVWRGGEIGGREERGGGSRGRFPGARWMCELEWQAARPFQPSTIPSTCRAAWTDRSARGYVPRASIQSWDVRPHPQAWFAICGSSTKADFEGDAHSSRAEAGHGAPQHAAKVVQNLCTGGISDWIIPGKRRIGGLSLGGGGTRPEGCWARGKAGLDTVIGRRGPHSCDRRGGSTLACACSKFVCDAAFRRS